MDAQDLRLRGVWSNRNPVVAVKVGRRSAAFAGLLLTRQDCRGSETLMGSNLRCRAWPTVAFSGARRRDSEAMAAASPRTFGTNVPAFVFRPVESEGGGGSRLSDDPTPAMQLCRPFDRHGPLSRRSVRLGRECRRQCVGQRPCLRISFASRARHEQIALTANGLSV
jgi:hypothetical protein